MVTVDPPRVLLVDDRRENRIALLAVLEPLRVDVVEAESGEAALREVLSRDFAVSEMIGRSTKRDIDLIARAVS